MLLQRAAQALTSPARASARATRYPTAAAAAGCSSSLERAMLGAPGATSRWGGGAASPQRDADAEAEDNMFDVPALVAPVEASAGWSECRPVRVPTPYALQVHASHAQATAHSLSLWHRGRAAASGSGVIQGKL